METNFDAKEEQNEKYSLRGRVFNKIRGDILRGRYHENQALKEINISNELGVSRTPVREAIKQLELEGLVTSIPNKGAIVHGILAKDIQDIYEVRSMIEGLATRWAAINITDEELDQLDEIVFLSEFHLSKGKYEQLYHLDNKYHEKIYQISNSRIIQHVLSDFHHYVQRVRKSALMNHDRAAESIKEHKNIIEAIRNKQYDEVERLANEHIINTITNVNNKNIIEDLEKI